MSALLPRRIALVLFAPSLLVGACGGGQTAVPGTRGASETQSSMMAQTFAGKNKCSAKNHDRPFVVEWDATDMASFESRAKTDVIFVHYEGCELKVLEGCVNDSVRGAFGSYRPVEWTSGSIESLAIENEGDLYAKLPLGAATLGGRVHGGERFKMEYFVAGTRSATRDNIYRSDLMSASGCASATHFVYGYNLGAFALGAATDVKGEVGGSVGGFGAGGSRSSRQKAEKSGGVIGTCRGESAKEVETCKTPIRLTLREISDGQNPDLSAAQMPDTPSAKNLAGKLQAQTEKEKKAVEMLEQARIKQTAKDGKACLAALDAHDKLDPRPGGLSTNTAQYWSQLRAQCLMLAGQCGVGKDLLRKSISAQSTQGPEMTDKFVEAQTATFCQGNNLGTADKVRRATHELQAAAHHETKEAAYCRERIKILEDSLPGVKPKDEDDQTVALGKHALETDGPGCLARAGECAPAWDMFSKAQRAKYEDIYKTMTPEARKTTVESLMKGTVKPTFDGYYPKCRGKI